MAVINYEELYVQSIKAFGDMGLAVLRKIADGGTSTEIVEVVADWLDGRDHWDNEVAKAVAEARTAGPTPDEHAAEAEGYLRRAKSAAIGASSAGPLAQLATAHFLAALLASRPTTPDNELVRRAIADETAELLNELAVSRARATELGEALQRLIVELYDHPSWTEPSDSLYEALHHAEEVVTARTTVPSTGEDQSTPGECTCNAMSGTPCDVHGNPLCTLCRHDKVRHDAEIWDGCPCGCREFRPVPEEDQSGTRGMSGAERIARERARQIEAEGWTPEHDDQHEQGELATGAMCYALAAVGVQKVASEEDPLGAYFGRDPASGRPFPPFSVQWPWDEHWKPSADPIRNLEKAGALIAAEIDRLLRLAVPDEGSETNGE